MYTSHHILKLLVEEQVADLRRDSAMRRELHESGRAHEKAPRSVRVPVQVTRQSRRRLPIIARGVARLDDYRSEGRRS